MADMRFEGDVIVVSGAGRGLGRAYALYLAQRGARVVVNDKNSESALQTVEAIRDAGGQAVGAPADITADGSAASVIDVAMASFGTVNAVLNNAGYGAPFKAFVDTPRIDLERMMAVHVTGTWELTRAAWPHFAEKGDGRVLITSAGGFYLGTVNNAPYNIAKGALYSLIRSLSVEGESIGIRVNGIAPAGWTPMWTDTGYMKEHWESIKTGLPVSAVAPVAAYLLHPDCTISGELIEAMGGRVARIFLSLGTGIRVEPDAVTMELVRDNFAQILDPADASPAPLGSIDF